MKFSLNYEKNVLSDILDTIHNVIKPQIDTTITKLKISGCVTNEPIPFSNRQEGIFEEMTIGKTWGKLFDCAWFLIEGVIPQYEQAAYFLKLDVSGEACLYDPNGTPIKGFTNGSSIFDRKHGEPGKRYYLINDFIKKDGSLALWLDCGCNDLFGSYQNNGEIIYCEIITRNSELEALYYDLEVLYSLLTALDKETTRYKKLLEGLKQIHYLVIYEEKNWLQKSSQISSSLLAEKSSNPLEITAIGHSHIDLAWLWPIRETKRKMVRTFSNVIDLLDHDEEFIFGVSQPQLLLWLKENSPQLYEKMKKYILAGRIEVQGGMWVEADTNLSGEEALVRQMLYGIKFYQEEFGIRVKSLWLPDVFGYSGSLPQIIKKSGLDYFMTTKLSWSLINRFPYHTFNWHGIDGTEVLCHMPPEGNYNSSMLPTIIKFIEDNYNEVHISNQALVLFGIGDGGGGPGYEHLERIQREKSLNPLPKIKYGRSDTFFDELADNITIYPHWQGELYLENHQGTYTSQSNVKNNNRRIEQKLKACETLLVSAGLFQNYKQTLETIWKEVLLYQFHDILPGSSIKRVYDECLARYDKLNEQLDSLLKSAFCSYEVSYKPNHLIYNPLLFDAKIINKVNNQYYIQTIEKLSTQMIEEEVFLEEANHFDGIIETNLLKVVFNLSNAQIMSIYDKVNNRELLSKPLGNKLDVYIDKGDAWNILDHYRKQTPTQMHLIEMTGRKYGKIYEITNRYEFKESTLLEVILIKEDDLLIEFKHELDWQNVGYMLRTSFPLTIKSDIATFDIQFGNIRRSRLNNTSIDSAQFEVSGHQWVDVSDHNYGVSLVNNAKYGFYIKEGILDMNLLRSTNFPCVDGDIARHSYSYGLYIHEGLIKESKVDQIAMQFNTFFPSFNAALDIYEKWLTIDQPNITYSSIKRSEDNRGTIIRLYENNGEETCAHVKIAKLSIKQIGITNLIEENEVFLTNKNEFHLTFKPFEIITIKVIE